MIMCFVFYWQFLLFSNVTLAIPLGLGCSDFPKHYYVFAFVWHSVSTMNLKTNYFVNVSASDWGPSRMPNPSLGQTAGSDFLWHLGYYSFWFPCYFWYLQDTFLMSSDIYLKYLFFAIWFIFYIKRRISVQFFFLLPSLSWSA